MRVCLRGGRLIASWVMAVVDGVSQVVETVTGRKRQKKNRTLSPTKLAFLLLRPARPEA